MLVSALLFSSLMLFQTSKLFLGMTSVSDSFGCEFKHNEFFARSQFTLLYYSEPPYNEKILSPLIGFHYIEV